MSSQLLQKQMQACVDNTMHGGGPPPPDFQKPAAGLSKEPGGGSGGPSRDVAHQNNALLSQQTTMLTTNTNAPPSFSTQNRSQALADPQKCFIVPPSIQLPVAPSTNSTSNANNRLVGNQVPTMIQDKATMIAINSASVVVPDGSDSVLTQQQQYKRAAGLHSISIDAVAATNYSKKIGKHQTFGAANQATKNDNSSDNHHVSIEQANHQTLAIQKKTNGGTEVNESQEMTTKMLPKIKHEGLSKNIKNENRSSKQKVESHSLGPMNNRVPRYNRSAPSQNNMGPQVSGPANTSGSCSLTYGNQHQYGHARGGAASYNSLAPVPAKNVNPSAYNQLLNSNPQQLLHYHHSQHNQKDRLANNYRSQNAVLVYQDQNQNTNTEEAAPPRGSFQLATMVLHQSQHQDGNRENEQKHISSRLKKPTNLKTIKQSAMTNQIQQNSAAIEDSYDSGHQGDPMVQHQSSAKMIPAGLSTVASQRSQQSSRRRTNIKQCQQMVAAYTSNTATNSNDHHELVAQDAAVPDHMPSTNQSQTNLHRSNHRRQSTEPAIIVSSQAGIEQYAATGGPMVLGANVQSNNQLALYELLQRNSLPPITTMSPMAAHQNNNSGISDSRKRGHGMKGLFPMVPGSTRAANQQHSQSLHADCQRVGGRRVQGGYRKNSNHTQLITKTKANLFDTTTNTAQGGKTRRSDGQFGGSGRVNSVKRTSNDKINQARQGYYACQCTEHLLSGNPNESKRAMNFLDCPDHITGPQTIAQLKSARNRQLKPYTINSVANATSSHRREAIMADPKTKMVKSAHVGGAASGGKQKKTYQQQSNQNNMLEDAHNAERFIQKSFTGNVNSGSLALDKPCVFDEPPVQVAQQMMRKTQLSIVGQQQHFTPQKPKFRKTFHQNDRALAKDSLNQNHQRKHLQAVPVQVIPSEDIKFASNKNTHGRKKRRLFGQTIYSDQSSRDGVAACVISQGAMDPEYTPHANQDSIGGVAAVTGSSTVSQMMRMQQVLNASSEKVNRRVLANTRRSNPDSAQGDAQGTEISQNNSSYGNQEENAADLYIKENTSTLASVEKQVRQKMRSEKEMYLEQIRKNEEARLQNLNLQQHSYESPGKINSQMPWATGLETQVSPHSNGTKNLQPQFSMGNMPAKNLTDVKTWATPPEAPQSSYQIGKGIRPNYAVPVNTMEKQGVQEQKFQNLSPLVMRLSNQSSAQDQSLQRPLLNFNLLQCSNQERKAEEDTKQKGGKDQPENKEPSPQELITMTKIDGQDFKSVQQTEDQNQSAPASPLKTPKKKLSRHSISQHNIVYDLDKAKSTPSLDDAAHLQTPRSKGEFESHQKSSRIASACPQNDRSPKMGDITNIARQQSVNQIMPQSQQTDYYSATEKQLSFRQFKNPNRATCVQIREHSGTKSSYEEAIRSEIASDMHIENSDELGQSGTARRASGRDFSCIFDADSEGPKQDKSEVQIDKARRQELQTVKRGQKLGEGSFGEVYQGLYDGAQSQYSGSYGSEQNALPPQMAIKVMRVEDKRLLSKLETELELLRTLKHRHIVQYYGCLINDEKNEASIFMELMPHSLQTQYRNFGPLHERVIKRHTKQILQALCYLHNHDLRIIHGDLKAANILSDAGCTKLTDFGDSRKLEALPQDLHASSESGAVLNEFKGSILWMAPECFTNSVVGRRSDIWSLGCTLIELASAQHPWHGIRDLYHLIQKLESQELPDIPDSLSPNAKDFIYKCLIYEKDKRPTAQELINHPFIDDGQALKTPAQQKNQETVEK